MAVPKASIIQFLLSQCRDSEGLLSNGKVYFYNPGTSDDTGVYVWLDPDATIAANNPYTLDANGTAQVYAYGSFRIVIKDSDGITRMDYDNIYFNSQGDYYVSANISSYNDDLAAAVLAIGSTNITLHIDIPITVTANLTVPANIVLERSQGGTITVSPGATLTIVTAPISPATQWFYGAGTVTVTGKPQEAAWWGSAEKVTLTNLEVTTQTGLKVGVFTFPTNEYNYRTQNLLDNLSFTATVAAKALTISLKGADGNAPSATNIVKIAFRSATLTTPTPVIRYITAATTLTLSSGSTLGFTSGEVGRMYVWAIDNAGTVELAISRTAFFRESNVVTTTAEGGAGGADSISIMYSTTQRTGVAFRCIGYIEIQSGATAGEWDNAASKVQVMGPGINRSGDVIQVIVTMDSTALSGTTAIPLDDTIPTSSEGDLFLTSTAIVPTSAVNPLAVEAMVNISNSAQVNGAVALFRDSDAAAIAATQINIPFAGGGTPVPMFLYLTAGSTSSTVFKIRAGCIAGTTYYNGYAGRYFGGVGISSIRITEIFA